MTLTRAEVCKRYYEKNKDKIKAKALEAKQSGIYDERIKNYKERTHEQRKEYDQNYYETNKEEILQKQKDAYYNNHEERLIKNRKSYHKNKKLVPEEVKEENRQKRKEYYKIKREENKPNIVKSNRIRKWKSRGVKCDDWDNLYDRYINTTNCEECNVELIEGIFGSNKRCLDHNHTTGEFRNVLCNLCNCRRR
jgi:hypothetical protein